MILAFYDNRLALQAMEFERKGNTYQRRAKRPKNTHESETISENPPTMNPYDFFLAKHICKILGPSFSY